MKIACNDEIVQSLLGKGFYRIPRFQRPYSWDEENLEEFWNDTVVDRDGDYFIGSFVLFQHARDSYGIVDGQQRITTITVLLCVLRNAFSELNEDSLAKGLQSLIEKTDINNKIRYIIETETSYPYFQEHIQKFGRPTSTVDVGDEERHLAAAFQFFSRRIREILDDTKGKSKQVAALTRIRDSILGLRLIYIEIDKEDDAYLIFETLNSRGKDLNPADLIKNSLTGSLRPKNTTVDVIKDQWNAMVDLLDESDQHLKLEEYLLHFWLSRYDFTTNKKLFRAFKRKVSKQTVGPFYQELIKDCSRYRTILEPGYGKWSKNEQVLRKSLTALSIFNVKLPLPMLLSILREYDEKRLRFKNAARALSAIEKFHFQFTAVTSQRSSGGISMMYANHAKDLHNEKDNARKIEGLEILTQKLDSKIPPSDEFLAGFKRIRYTETMSKDKRLVQYVLGKIADNASSGIAIDYDQMTIEHILPQSSGTAHNIVGEIGNLILVDGELNKKLGNKPFAEKKKILTASQVPMDDIIKNATKWGAVEIQKHTEYYADIAYKHIWAI